MSDIHDDLRATLETRKHLGPDYEAALVESFVARLDATIAERVRAEVDAQRPAKGKKNKSNGGGPMVPIALGSMGMAIPLSAIAGGQGFLGLALVWIGIVVINVAAAVAVMRRD
ncbi:hypothetical protein [Nonomuraea africana]|uniref:DUF1707 domain-containing protein n=1 Tax=Nonomuraea africana TaxID=46171 RepID=A0ABR9KFU3_9ACTN|nr:hypothetical protein [Nonomuraea africana]MBE1560412.1 hypothetical protein [Nonomuraea africana]